MEEISEQIVHKEETQRPISIKNDTSILLVIKEKRIKPQVNNAIYLLECLKLENLSIQNANKDKQQPELSCTFDGNENGTILQIAGQ